ncbi:MAG: hypothetical protein ACLR54_07030 [Oscillospiraceae bacterium]
MRKRITALLLAFVMTASLLPVTAQAVSPEAEAQAAVITTAAEFAAMTPDGAYRLGADITVDAPYDKTFTGSLDGAYHTVTLALHVTADDTDASWGLFRALNGAAIRDLRLAGELAAAEDSPAKNVGALAGTVSGDTTVSGCRSEVQISVSAANSRVGGLVGSVAGGTLSLTGCANAGTVKALNSAAAGGLVGSVLSGSVTIQRSYQYSDVLGGVCAGGLMGQLAEQAECTASYSYAAVSADDKENADASALTGWGEVKTISGEKAGALCGQGTFSAESKALFWPGKAFGTDAVPAGGQFEEMDINTVLAALNDGTAADDANGFLLTAENGGWPLLRWELTQPQVPDMELDSKKETLKSQLAEVWSQYHEASYEPEDWAALTKLYNDALAAIAAARTVEELPLLSELMANMAAIPGKTYTELTAEEKQAAIRRIQVLYEKYLKQLEEKEAVFDESSRGVWLSLTMTGREQLDAAREALEQQQATALTALNDCKTTAEVDALAENCEAAMQKIVEDLQVAVQANDVPEEKKWDGKTMTQPASGSGTKNDPYLIGTGAELAWFADQVKNGKITLCAKLTADIDLNGHPWTPIGSFGSSKNYQGTFDGCNSTVNGLQVSDKSYAGLFGVIGASGVVERLIVAGMISITSVSGNGIDNVGAGGIAGYCKGTIFQCSSSVDISNTGMNYSAVAGGIVGRAAEDAIVDSCNNYGTVGSQKNINYAGGIVGVACENAVIRYCTNGNEGAVNGVQGVGGIVGLLTDYAQVRLCENQGAVDGESRVGGVVGWVGKANYISGSVLDVIIMNVLNKAPVNGSSGSPAMNYGTGGIVGCIDTGSNTGLTGPCTLSYAYNTGSVTDNGSTTAQGVGGIVGDWHGGEIRHVQSASANMLWGMVDVANTNSHDAARVSCVTPSFTMASGSWDKVSATAQLLAKLIRPGDEKYGIYGTEQSIRYNGIVLSYIERIELADGDADALVQECEEQLATVLSGTDAGGKQLLADLHAYVDSRVYAAEEQAKVNELLAAAEEEIKAAKTIADIDNIRLKYLGEGNELSLSGVITYPTKVQLDLYNRFITNKKYSQEDMAALLAAYESWKLKLDQAASAEEIEIIKADAGKALTDLTATFTEGETAPDMDAAAAAALQKARDTAQQELDTLAQQHIAELTAQLGDISSFDEERQKLLTDALERGKTAIETAAAVELDDLSDYAAIEQARQEGLAAIEQAYTSASGKLKKLLDSARAEDGWNGITTSQPHGKGTEDEPYQIGTAQEMAWLAYAVNNQMESEGYYAVLTADIDLGYCQWPVIGVLSSNGQRAYTGTFDGQGHTVSGLNITSLGGRQKLGLFGVAQDAVIENLTVRGNIDLTGVRSYDTTTGYIIGGVLGSGEGGVTISNCVSQVDVSVSFANDQKAQRAAVGGLVGRLSGSGSHTLTDCRSEGRVYTAFAPGACYLGGSGGDGGQAGIVGFISAGARLERCVNAGEVYAGRAAGVGGIVGSAGSSGTEVTLSQCANQGAVSNDTAAVLLNKGGTGGVLGLAAAGTVTVRSCYNTGSVAGSTIVGGILGGERGEYSANAQYGCRGLTLENCYNAGGLLVGTATVRVGALAGYPLDGRYYTGLTVRKGACRFVMGWKCSQGDSVKESAVLTADTLFEGLVDSIGGVNSGYPLFDWQLLEQQSREEVISCLNDRYEREIKPIATAAQCQEIEKLLTETAETIRTAETTADIAAAYDAMVDRMNADDLLTAAREAAQKQLTRLYNDARRYRDIAQPLAELYEKEKAAIEECASSVDTDAVLARFPAGVADLLIAARVKSGAAMWELAAALPEVRQVYNALTAAQKRLVVNGRAITDAQVLVTAYEQNLDLLRQWESADKAKYTAVKSGIGRLAADIRSRLGDCADASGMTAALNGYAAGVARLLLDKLAFTEGTTTLGQLHKASEVLTQTSEAVKGLTREQLALLPAEQVAGVSRAQLLLAVYTRASEQLDTWLKNDKASYADVAQRLERLADSVRQELERSVDRDSAAKALDHYCGGSVEVLISSIGTVKPVMPPTEAAAAKTRLQRARTAYNALTASQKALVPNYASLQEGETAYRTYESNYAAAKAAESLISAIGTVTADSGDAIRKAQEAYDALTAEQKQLVDARLVQQMETAAAQYRQLLAQSAENGGETPSADETMSDGVKPADRMQPTDQTRPEQAQPFDWSLVWLGGGILASAAAIALILRWLAAVRRTEKKNKA